MLPKTEVKEKVKKLKTAKEQKAIKDFLKANGKKAVEVDVLDFSNEIAVIYSTVKLHGLDMTQYKSGGVG